MLYRDADSEEASEVFSESGLENGVSEEQQHTCSLSLPPVNPCPNLSLIREKTFHTSTGALKHVHTQKAPGTGMLREDAEQSSWCDSQASWPSVTNTR